ncbi:hypothetical protein PPYR_13997 [Photinus pyralis]|nr:hypothetical protein PPYR_13997 [Photinus pyralis]
MKAITAVIISMLIANVWASTVTYLDSTTATPETKENDDDDPWYMWILIYPGTKWCGAGNISDTENDLGSAHETDGCCRAHDYCDDTITANATAHNLTNNAPFTLSNCKCDDQFYACLKKADTSNSRRVGRIFFNYLGTKCFREDYPVVKCTKSIYFPRYKCLEYEYDTTKDKKYQWFNVPQF